MAEGSGLGEPNGHRWTFPEIWAQIPVSSARCGVGRMLTVYWASWTAPLAPCALHTRQVHGGDSSPPGPGHSSAYSSGICGIGAKKKGQCAGHQREGSPHTRARTCTHVYPHPRQQGALRGLRTTAQASHPPCSVDTRPRRGFLRGNDGPCCMVATLRKLPTPGRCPWLALRQGESHPHRTSLVPSFAQSLHDACTERPPSCILFIFKCLRGT